MNVVSASIVRPVIRRPMAAARPRAVALSLSRRCQSQEAAPDPGRMRHSALEALRDGKRRAGVLLGFGSRPEPKLDPRQLEEGLDLRDALLRDPAVDLLRVQQEPMGVLVATFGFGQEGLLAGQVATEPMPLWVPREQAFLGGMKAGSRAREIAQLAAGECESHIHHAASLRLPVPPCNLPRAATRCPSRPGRSAPGGCTHRAPAR
jgi:hypothetical protein